MSVKVQDVSKYYDSQKAVDHISFEAKPGEILGFLGPNGAGKTTTMKMITGFLPPSHGTISVCGINIQENRIEASMKLGYLPEHNPLYLEMYVKEYLEFCAKLHGIKRPKDQIKKMIYLTGLEKEQHKKIGQLSKGYRQRVGLAQAIIHDPEVLILDEPTSGLDPNQLKEIRQLIKSLGEKKTLIFSTHIMQEVQALCDRVIIIHQGAIIADNPIGELQHKIHGDFAVKVVFDRQVPKEKIGLIPGVKHLRYLGDNVYTLSTSKDLDVRHELFKLAVEQQAVILEMTQESLSVEEIFQQLTVAQDKKHKSTNSKN